jgi:hypothetical protein
LRYYSGKCLALNFYRRQLLHGLPAQPSFKRKEQVMKRLAVLLLSLVLTLSLAGLSLAEDKEIDRADRIKQAQEGLVTLDYYKGDASGKMNPETREAVKAFKKKEMDMKMPTGMLDEKTCDMICKKADEKKKKDKEGEKSAVDKAKEKVDEGKSKIMPGVDMPK